MKLSTLSITAVFGLSLVVLAPIALAANTQIPQVNQRQHQQMHRIKQGIKSGELTRKESKHLLHEQKRIRKEAHHYRADGIVTPRERADLHRDQDRASFHIYKQKHDAQERY